MSVERVQLLIDGAWADGRGREEFVVIDPAEEEAMGTAVIASTDDVDAAAQAAARAFEQWSWTPPSSRTSILRKAGALARERLPELARLLTLEQGKPLRDARGEIQASIDALEYYSEETRRIFGKTIPTEQPTRRSLVIRQPVGPVAAIGPWNYPVLLLVWKVAPALAAGCTVVVKPPSRTPVAITRFLQCLADAGAPPGVVNTVVGAQR